MAVGKSVFHIADYVVCCLLLVGSIAIGIFYALSGGKQKTTAEFLMGDRQLKVIPVALSILATFTSAISLMGNATEMYVHGTQFWLYVIAYVLGGLIVAYIIVPMLYPLKLVSVYEYFELRFQSKILRVFASFLMLLCQILMCGVTLFGPALALAAVSPIPTWVGIVTLGIVATFYTAVGGMKAVIWTDVFMSVVILAGLLAIVIQGSIEVGGMARIWRLNEEWDRIEFLNFDPDPTVRTSVWSTTIIMAFLVVCIYTTQSSVQRFSSLPTMAKAQAALVMNGPGTVLFASLTCLAGVTAFGYYASKRCDPIRNGDIENPNQILSYFVSEVMYKLPGLPGLFMACLFSGTLSTISSALTSCAAMVWEDMLKERSWCSHLSEKAAARVTKLLVYIFGVLSIAGAFLAAEIGGTLIEVILILVGSITGPIIGLIFLGGIFPRVNWRAASIGILVGISLSLWVSVGAYVTKSTTLPLPSPIDGCVSGNSSLHINVTHSPYIDDNGFGLDVSDTHAYYSVVTDPVPGRNTTEAPVTGVKLLYKVSHLWYHMFGIGGTMIVGLFLSLFPGMKETEPVADKVLFPIVLALLRKCGCRKQDIYEVEKEAIKQNETDMDMKEAPNGQDYKLVPTTECDTKA